MERKQKKLLMSHPTIKEDMQVAVPTSRGWQRAIVTRINNDETVQLMLRDWGAFKRHSIYRIYRLEKQFCEMDWHAIPCDLAYAGPTTRGLEWPTETKDLTRILAENQEGDFRILKPVGNNSALIKFSITRRPDASPRDLLEDLIELGHAYTVHIYSFGHRAPVDQRIKIKTKGKVNLSYRLIYLDYT
jgi:hypothetical protein